MKTCPFCAEAIQGAAIVCKHCGRDQPPPPPPLPVKPAPVWLKRLLTLGLAALVLYALAAVVLSLYLGGPTPTSSSRSKTETLKVDVGWSMTALYLTNRGSLTGQEVTVYINGTPPFTFKAEAILAPPGDRVEIPLTSFTMKDGTRFNPFAKAVTVVWVGGHGFDYEQYHSAR